MAIVFMTDPVTGRCALFDENGTSGDPADPNSTRNAPLNSPMSHLDKLYFHSDFDNLEVSNSGTANINHSPVAAGSLPPDATIAFGWNAASADHLLLTHNLGYVPYAMVARGSNILWPGMPVQTDASGGGRYVSAYCTTTQVRLYEWASIGSSTLAGTNLSYTILVFKNPPAPTGNILLDFNPATGATQMGLGKFDSSRRYLQVVPGGSPLGISYGRTIDLKNGAFRAARPDGTTVDPVPAALKLGAERSPGWPRVYGASMAYNGSFTAPTAIQVQAP